VMVLGVHTLEGSIGGGDGGGGNVDTFGRERRCLSYNGRPHTLPLY